MMFNLKLFVLVGILAGFRDVYGTEDVKDKDDDGFIVDGLKNTKEENEVKVARDERRVIKAVYEPWSCGNVPIIHESFKDKLFKVLVRAGKGEDVVKEVDISSLNNNVYRIHYDMQKKVEYTVYFIFKVKILDSTAWMFEFCYSLIHADFRFLNTTNVENMSYMFSGCTVLRELNFSAFNTTNVTNMCFMFSNCSSLTKLDLSKFDTTSVTDMNMMFNECTALTELNLSSFNTQSVTDMSCMFSNCSALTELGLSKFDTQNVTNMSSMFFNCSSLAELNLSNFDTTKVTDMSYMFYKCSSLTKLDLSKFNTTKVTNMANMFAECTLLNQVFLPSTCAEKKKRCICCGDEYVLWNNHEVEGLNPDITTFKAPNKINLMIPTKK